VGDSDDDLQWLASHYPTDIDNISDLRVSAIELNQNVSRVGCEHTHSDNGNHTWDETDGMQHGRETKNPNANLVGEKDQGCLDEGVSFPSVVTMRDSYPSHAQLLSAIRIVDFPSLVVIAVRVCWCVRDLSVRLRW
jgi:hypothetical protein